MHCPTLVLVEGEAEPGGIHAGVHRVLGPSSEWGGREGELARWDWYAVGGRFADWLKGVDWCPVRRLSPGVADRIMHLVEPNGVWHDRQPDWCWPSSGMPPPASWVAEATEVLSAYPEALAVMVDIHH